MTIERQLDPFNECANRIILCITKLNFDAFSKAKMNQICEEVVYVTRLKMKICRSNLRNLNLVPLFAGGRGIRKPGYLNFELTGKL
jgi:hypothetical protein